MALFNSAAVAIETTEGGAVEAGSFARRAKAFAVLRSLAVSGLLANSQNGYLLGAAFFIVSFLFTQIMLNKAVYGIFIPIAIMTCQALGANPIGPILLCFSGSMSAILTPMATPAIPMAMAAGGYDQKSLLKQGWLISVLLCVGYIFFIMTVFPAF